MGERGEVLVIRVIWGIHRNIVVFKFILEASSPTVQEALPPKLEELTCLPTFNHTGGWWGERRSCNTNRCKGDPDICFKTKTHLPYRGHLHCRLRLSQRTESGHLASRPLTLLNNWMLWASPLISLAFTVFGRRSVVFWSWRHLQDLAFCCHTPGKWFRALIPGHTPNVLV